MPARALLVAILLVTAGSLHLDAGEPQTGLKLRWYEGRPVVDGLFVNRHGPYRFLLDTGTSLNHLDPKKALLERCRDRSAVERARPRRAAPAVHLQTRLLLQFKRLRRRRLKFTQS